MKASISLSLVTALALMLVVSTPVFAREYTHAPDFVKRVTQHVYRSWYGTLQGHVSFGSDCAAQPCIVSHENEVNAYDQYTVRVYRFRQHHRRLVAEVPIDEQGSYHVRLRPGRYVVDIYPNHWYPECDLERGICADVERGANVPALVKVRPHRVTVFDIIIGSVIRVIES